MTPQQIVALIVRLASVYLGYLVFVVATSASFINTKDPVVPSFLLFALEGGLILIAALFWFFPMAIANKLISKTRETNVMNLPARQAAAAGSALIGLWAMVKTVPQFTMTLFKMLYLGLHEMGMGVLDMSFASMVAPAIQLAIGIFLLSRPWAVAEKIFPEMTEQAAVEQNAE